MIEVERKLEEYYHSENMHECKSEDEILNECIRHRSKIQSLYKEEQNEREL